MRKFNFGSRITSIFEKMETSYEEVKNLMFDLYRNELDEGVTKKEAEEKLRNFSLEIFGLTKDSSKRDRKRAYEKYGREFFDVIEEVISSSTCAQAAKQAPSIKQTKSKAINLIEVFMLLSFP